VISCTVQSSLWARQIQPVRRRLVGRWSCIYRYVTLLISDRDETWRIAGSCTVAIRQCMVVRLLNLRRGGYLSVDFSWLWSSVLVKTESEDCYVL